jgi:hypothetical protein
LFLVGDSVSQVDWSYVVFWATSGQCCSKDTCDFVRSDIPSSSHLKIALLLRPLGKCSIEEEISNVLIVAKRIDLKMILIGKLPILILL